MSRKPTVTVFFSLYFAAAIALAIVAVALTGRIISAAGVFIAVSILNLNALLAAINGALFGVNIGAAVTSATGWAPWRD